MIVYKLAKMLYKPFMQVRLYFFALTIKPGHVSAFTNDLL